MISRVIAAALVAGMAATGAGAATLDFIGEADNNGERGVASGYVLNSDYTDNTNVTLTSNYKPYFDEGGAGLGVCQLLTGPDQCTPSSDDNVTFGEWVALGFDSAVNLSALNFRGEGHIDFNSSTKTLLIGTNGGSLARMTFAAAAGMVFNNITSIRFQFDGANPRADQFYVGGATIAPVPVPASLPLLVGGLGLMGWAARRRRKA